MSYDQTIDIIKYILVKYEKKGIPTNSYMQMRSIVMYELISRMPEYLKDAIETRDMESTYCEVIIKDEVKIRAFLDMMDL